MQKGFTIIEMVVVMAVFLIVIGASISLFISIVQSQKGVLGSQDLLNQASYIAERITKGLRMAGRYSEGIKWCTGENNIYSLTHAENDFYKGIKFVNESDGGACTEFYAGQDGILYEAKSYNETETPSVVALTSDNLAVDLKFAINGMPGCSANSSACVDSAKSLFATAAMYLILS